VVLEICEMENKALQLKKHKFACLPAH